MRIDVVEREPVAVIYAAAPGEWDAIPAAAARAFERLEASVPPRGRKLYGYWHPPLLEYRACYAREPRDLPDELGLREEVIPGGAYRRARIVDDDAFAQIPAGFDALQAVGPVAEDDRPWLEFYRRHNMVDLLVPIAAVGA